MVSLGLTVLVLIVNANTGMYYSLAASCVGLILLIIAYFSGQKRMEPVLTWVIVLLFSALLGSSFLRLDLDAFGDAAARIWCGVIWVLWLGTQLDWRALRRVLLVFRVPETIVSSLDHALMHGVLTQREWSQRRDAARLRLGTSRVSVKTLGQLLGEGALHAFSRLEQVEKNMTLRSSIPKKNSGEKATCLRGVSVKRGEKLVLNDISLDLKAAEWVLVCGPSGAGKSSLLRLLAGLDAPEDGTLTRLGVSVTQGASLPARLDGRVALLVQNPEHHFVASTVVEDIMWGLLQRGVGEEEARLRCEQITAELHIDHLLDRPCYELSFGEQRRVAIAGLIVLEPKLLLLDEPTSGLDPVAAHKLQELVRATVARSGATCVWATHDLNSVPSQAQRVVLMNGGSIIFDGPKNEGLSQPWLIRSGLAVAQPGDDTCS